MRCKNKNCNKSILPWQELHIVWMTTLCSEKCKKEFIKKSNEEQREKKRIKIEKDKIRKVKKKEKKRTSFSRLVKDLDSIFSKYIRHKHSTNWNCECISCWKIIPIPQAQNCHWINRWNRLYRWSEENCKPWCSSCNIFNKEFHLREYTVKQIEMYWIEKINEMRYNAKQVWEKPSRDEIMDKLEVYKLKLKNIWEH